MTSITGFAPFEDDSDRNELSEFRDQFYEGLALKIREYGFTVIGIFDSNPSFSYTVGLSPKIGYEILVFGLPPEIACIILNLVYKKIDTLVVNTPDPRFANMPLMFKIADQRAQEFVVQASQYYRKPVNVMQLVLCDKTGNFPDQPNYDHVYMDPRQPILF
jgi:hypothetical protein